MKTTALIMAGGRGERFWPKSRQNLPKQFLSLTNDGKTMLQLTVDRILPLVELEDIYIVTNRDYQSLICEQLPGIPAQNILCEPAGRNTAPCIGLGAIHIAQKYDDALMLVLPSDHLIKDTLTFTDILSEACEIAAMQQNLVTIGITPNYPETGYGYIKLDKSASCRHAFAVDRFVEKPHYELAKEYVDSGEYFWNSGMFVWKVSSIIHNLRTYLPAMYQGLLEIKLSIGTSAETAVLEAVFPTLEAISIDYGIMEKAQHIYILPGAFGWDDVGSWLAIERVKTADPANNTITGNAILVNSTGCIIEGGDKLIAAVGLKNVIIVDAGDAVLVCSKDAAGDIRKVLEELRNTERTEYL